MLRRMSFSQYIHQVPASPLLYCCVPFFSHKLVVGSEKVDKVSTAQEHTRLLLGFNCEAYLLRWLDPLGLLPRRWDVDVEVGQVAYVRCFLTPSFGNCHLSVRLQRDPSFIPCARSVRMIHIDRGLLWLLLRRVLRIQLLVLAIAG